MTLPTTRASTQTTERSRTCAHSFEKLIVAGCGSSRSWFATTPLTSTPGSSALAVHPEAARSATSTSGATSDERYKEARIIFRDVEPSNWSWDDVAGQYYWHRFYAQQPDLNFANPQVRREIFKAMDFWFSAGVDGLRLDAVPYLYEREGTNCENLPETHAFLRELRARIDARYDNRLLLAEANQWPEDAVAYFGDGDECHMCFHFPLMPRMYMALRTEDRFPIVDILAQTPAIPESSQWALFLRNHDELTLEMVTDEERDYMWRVYASDSLMRLNLGIRRRLAPLLGNDRRRMELLYGLLLSMPGTPVLYYGDEIGMGDDVALGDRNGVRTPMQWNAIDQRGLLHRRSVAVAPSGDHATLRTTTKPSTSRPSRPTPTRSCGSRSASLPCASNRWSSVAARSSS